MTTAALAVPEPESERTALAPVRGAIGLLKPIADVGAMMQAQQQVREFIKNLLVPGRDYAVVPGTDRQGKAKPSLHKPGAEKVALAFGLTAEFRIVEQTIDHTGEYPWVKRKWEWHPTIRGKKEWSEEKGVSYGLYRFVVQCDLRHRESGVVVASCVGVCSTMESKYCDRPRDCENTALKMSQKRAFVGATLIAGGLSDEFTQDIEDMPREMFGGDDAREEETEDTAAVTAPICPKCGGKMYDNRATKRNPKAPDFKCRDRTCDGCIWPPKEGEAGNGGTPVRSSASSPASATGASVTSGATTGASGAMADEPIADIVDGSGELLDVISLSEARAMKLPGEGDAWGGKAGTPLGELKLSFLVRVRDWARNTVAKEESRTLRTLIAACGLVIAHLERNQTALPLETPASAPTAASVDVPPPGLVQDAITGPVSDAPAKMSAKKGEKQAISFGALPWDDEDAALAN